jgi:hypothetical protein
MQNVQCSHFPPLTASGLRGWSMIAWQDRQRRNVDHGIVYQRARQMEFTYFEIKPVRCQGLTKMVSGVCIS